MLCLLLFSVVVLRHDDDFARGKMRREKSKGRRENDTFVKNTTLESNYTSPSSSLSSPSPSSSVVAVSVVVLSTSYVV